MDKAAKKEQEILDIEKERLEYQIQISEEIIDAYNSIVKYGIDQLKDHQEEINNLYDEEISKLEDINNEKKRSIELTKLQ